MSNVVNESNYDADVPPILSQVIERLGSGVGRVGISGLKGSSPSFLLSLLRRKVDKHFLLITPTVREAEECYQELLFFLGDALGLRCGSEKEKLVYLYPSGEEIPFENLSRNPELTSQRIEVLHHLLRGGKRLVVVSPLQAVVKKIIPRSILKKYTRQLKVGEEREREELTSLFVKSGYLKVSLVEDRGDYGVRGSIVDIFPPGYSAPLRIEFYGDMIESIRQFEVPSQRSFGELSEVWITPVCEAILEEEDLPQIAERIKEQAGQALLPLHLAGELIESLRQFQVHAETECFFPYLYPRLETLFDYLPLKSCIYLKDSEEIQRAHEDVEVHAEERYEQRREQMKFTPRVADCYLSTAERKALLSSFHTVYLDKMNTSLPEQEVISLATCSNEDIRQELINVTSPQGMLSPLVERIQEWQEEGNRILLICHSLSEAQKQIQLLEEYGVASTLLPEDHFTSVMSLPSPEVAQIQVASFNEGFRFPLFRLIIITEEEIFGEKKRRTLPKLKSGFFISDFSDLKSGDCVVHTDHGVGIYQGLKRLEVEGECGDYLLIEYLENDKLYLPVDRIRVVQKYVGTDGHTPKIDRLGGTSWKRTKKKVKASIKEMANELLELYASRKLLQGVAFSPIDHYYREFQENFPYEETPDQLAAIEDVMRDMSEAKPMDRLICGDVGYGKTEVALRSSFRAAMDGKQVAVLVPTTILAQQHYQTFCERLKPYPLRVEMLSRFRTRTEQKSILKELGEGKIDIIIGTHRLVQNDVHFKELGLLVLDEEQRFGVAHKEKLKKMRKVVDVLTLTATPIPRTLQMSLVGIREMSVISTPPEDRLSIKTFINRFESSVIREAVVRELRRGGQIFFVHDRVRSIPAMARFLSELVPEAKIAIAHGQLSERQLEKVMLSFIEKEVNLLLTTTIIESGLDFPSANTIIINRADKLGLAQLYQLRGRVGRSKYRAYCYLLIPGESVLSREAQERLQAIFEFSELGSSFRLATRDLEIRGAGNLLGASQSGHIAAIGLDLYTQLMEETIAELKGEERTPEIDPEIHLPLPAFIPEEYIGDVNQRLVVYKRLAYCSSDEEVEILRDELTDRYGKVPLVVDNLLRVIAFKNYLRQLLVSRIDYNGSKIILTFHPRAEGSLEKVLALIARDSRRYRLSPEMKLSIAFHADGGGEVIDEVKKLLQ